MAKQRGTRLIANNKKAYHDYFIEDKYEAGIALAGTEVKSLRMGKCSIKESFIRIENEEAYIYHMHISPYEKGNIFNHQEKSNRKLLVHKKEILKLSNKVMREGYTIIPLRIVLRNGIAKMDIAIAKGKKLYDKRQDLAKKDAERQIAYQLKNRNM